MYKGSLHGWNIVLVEIHWNGPRQTVESFSFRQLEKCSSDQHHSRDLGFVAVDPFVELGHVSRSTKKQKKQKNIWNKWQRSVQQCGLRPLKLGSHVTLLTRSHGEADVNKMEISVVQQPAVVTHWYCKYQTWSSGGVTLGLETPHVTRWSVSDGMFFDRALHWCI